MRNNPEIQKKYLEAKIVAPNDPAIEKTLYDLNKGRIVRVIDTIYYIPFDYRLEDMNSVESDDIPDEILAQLNPATIADIIPEKRLEAFNKKNESDRLEKGKESARAQKVRETVHTKRGTTGLFVQPEDPEVKIEKNDTVFDATEQFVSGRRKLIETLIQEKTGTDG
jgi:hypothetical protein